MKKFMEPKLEVLAYAVEECVSVSGNDTGADENFGGAEEE